MYAYIVFCIHFLLIDCIKYNNNKIELQKV